MPRFFVVSRASVFCVLALCSCNDHPLKPVDYNAELEKTMSVDLDVNRDVDILFVIDNSGSMADEQKILSANFERFVARLDADDVKANYRIGVTTTDMGNPVCTGSNQNSPENGKLQMSSCRERLSEFWFQETDQTEACLSVCRRDGFEITPTLALDGEVEPRRWLERSEGELNVPQGWTAAEAFGCFGPQGIAGCGFESPLEAVHRALRLADDSSSPSYGFLRPHAILAVVVVTDELDCSHNPDHGEIFGDNDQFFPDGEHSPTSAICWHAGVACTGDGTPFDECGSVDLDVDGMSVEADAASTDAVLYPVARYIESLREIERQKQQISRDQRVIVSVLSGVPRGYATFEEDLAYVEAQSEAQAHKFGVEPGCVGQDQQALPPVRLREWAEAFPHAQEDRRNLYSVCDDDYSDALQAVADEIIGQLRPACFEHCALDSDPHAPGVQPVCEVVEEIEGTSIELPECERHDDGTYARNDDGYVVPEDSDACYVLRSDSRQHTADPHDDMADECVRPGKNLQFDLQRRRGKPKVPGSNLSASCQLSPAPSVDCPDGD